MSQTWLGNRSQTDSIYLGATRETRSQLVLNQVRDLLAYSGMFPLLTYDTTWKVLTLNRKLMSSKFYPSLDA